MKLTINGALNTVSNGLLTGDIEGTVKVLSDRYVADELSIKTFRIILGYLNGTGWVNQLLIDSMWLGEDLTLRNLNILYENGTIDDEEYDLIKEMVRRGF